MVVMKANWVSRPDEESDVRPDKDWDVVPAEGEDVVELGPQATSCASKSVINK
jgi:hypothetical protein